MLLVEGGEIRPLAPAAAAQGTRVEVRDLFYATPARLKFLKSPRAEFAQAVDTVKSLAMAHHGKIGRAAWRERSGPYVEIPEVACSLKKQITTKLRTTDYSA